MYSKPHVLCFQQRLTHYREAFFQGVKNSLNDRGIEFSLVVGRPDEVTKTKNDSGHLAWAYEVDSLTLRLAGVTGVWVPTPKSIAKPDMVIVTQENKLLANYYWIIRRLIGGVKVAFWGHGRNLQSDVPTGFLERWKGFWLNRVDWWFAYTEMTRQLLLSNGYPAENISQLNNAIDNKKFVEDLNFVSDYDLNKLRVELGLLVGQPVGLFCGSLYPDKRIDFMIRSLDLIHNQMPNFSMVVIGDGPSASEIKAALLDRPWLHWVGAKRGRDKAVYFELASIIIHPGLVGLNVLDSFCAGVPLITMPSARHGPEISYLNNGVNCLIVHGSESDYASAVIKLLNDFYRLNLLSTGARNSSNIYSLDNMIEQFVSGIEKCLLLAK